VEGNVGDADVDEKSETAAEEILEFDEFLLTPASPSMHRPYYRLF
jgi:hypothetical protein